jgi:hypothetical protein
MYGKYRLLLFADDVNVFGESIYTMRKNTAVLSVAIKEICLEVNAEKTKYVSMP